MFYTYIRDWNDISNTALDHLGSVQKHGELTSRLCFIIIIIILSSLLSEYRIINRKNLQNAVIYPM